MFSSPSIAEKNSVSPSAEKAGPWVSTARPRPVMGSGAPKGPNAAHISEGTAGDGTTGDGELAGGEGTATGGVDGGGWAGGAMAAGVRAEGGDSSDGSG